MFSIFRKRRPAEVLASEPEPELKIEQNLVDSLIVEFEDSPKITTALKNNNWAESFRLMGESNNYLLDPSTVAYLLRKGEITKLTEMAEKYSRRRNLHLKLDRAISSWYLKRLQHAVAKLEVISRA